MRRVRTSALLLLLPILSVACGREATPEASSLRVEFGSLRQFGWVNAAEPDALWSGHPVLVQAYRRLKGAPGMPEGLGARLCAFRFNAPPVRIDRGPAVLAAMTTGMASWNPPTRDAGSPAAIDGVEGAIGVTLHCEGRSRNFAGLEGDSRVSMLVVVIGGEAYGVRVEMWRSRYDKEGLLLDADYLLSAGVELRR